MAALTEHTVAYAKDKHIFYLGCGPPDGPLLIFCHGWPGIAKTWIHQLNAFAALGFRCLAPDMPGYGRSAVTDQKSDYSQQAIVVGMLAVLDDAGRDAAVWIGHDWGSACMWSLAAHYPHKCTALVSMAVPYRIAELSIDECVGYADRTLYPADKYPDAQFSYMRYYQDSFDEAVAFHNSNVAGFTKRLFSMAGPRGYGQPSTYATTVRDGGWFGGAATAPAPEDTPDESVILSPELLAELTAALEKHGFFAPDSYYANHAANRAYNTAADVDPVLRMPVLFIGARFDTICQTATSRLAEPQRRLCRNLTEVQLDANHFVQLERPTDTNAVMASWLATDVSHAWPGAWRGVARQNLAS